MLSRPPRQAKRLRETRADIPHIRGNLEGYAGAPPAVGGRGGLRGKRRYAREMILMAETSEVPDGQVKITSHGDDWLLVEIGRGRYVKRFNLRRGEASELARELDEFLDR